MTMDSGGMSVSVTFAYSEPSGPKFFICAMSTRRSPSFLKRML